MENVICREWRRNSAGERKWEDATAKYWFFFLLFLCLPNSSLFSLLKPLDYEYYYCTFHTFILLHLILHILFLHPNYNHISQRRKEYCKRDSKTYRPKLFSWWQIRFFFVSFAAIDFQDINLDLLFLLVLFYFSLYLHVRVDVMYSWMSQRL